MSGGSWGYKSHELDELANNLASTEIFAIIKAAAETEHIIDWAESCDTSRESAEKKLYDLWLNTFNSLWGELLALNAGNGRNLRA